MKIKDIIAERSEWIPGSGYAESAPVVSVLLPTYNRARDGLFAAAVRSVLKQTLTNIELIIIDDCSADGTQDLISDFMKADDRVSCIQHKTNIGLPAISEYEGYLKARGKYLAFIFDDNEWIENALEKTIAFMESENIQASYGVTKFLQKGNDAYYLGSPDINLDNLYVGNFIGNGSVVLHREVIETVGLYDPHFSLTRLCDWDLWLRVSNKFEFRATGILFSTEKGVTLEDSLGNTYSLDAWCSYEQARYDRDKYLVPEHFPEYEIDGHCDGKSEHFLAHIIQCREKFKDKEWFRSCKGISDAFSASQIKPAENSKRVAILNTLMDASVHVVLNRLAKNSSDYILRFYLHPAYSVVDLTEIDALIITRDILFVQPIIDAAYKVGIPVYYYTDDNFVDLAKDHPENEQWDKIAALTNKDYFEAFRGVIVSSPELGRFFRESGIAENIILVEPSIGSTTFKKPEKEKNIINVSFFGGTYRARPLEQYVIPSLIKLSEKIPIRLFCPENEVLRDDETAGQFEIVTIPRSVSFQAAFMAYATKGIDVQVHPSVEQKNNKYKNQNALINATQMGAVLVTSECPPFGEDAPGRDCYLAVKDDETAWCSALEQVIFDDFFRRALYEKAFDYCSGHFSPEKNFVDLGKEISRAKKKRTLWEVDPLSKCFIKPLEHIPAVVSELDRRAFPCGQGKRRYNSLCPVENLSACGVIFQAFSLREGTVSLSIMHKGKVLREASLDIAKLNYRQWNYFVFDVLPDCKNVLFEIVLRFNYQKDSELLEVCEDQRKRSFLHKVLNKVGIRPRKQDLLLMDWVEPA